MKQNDKLYRKSSAVTLSIERQNGKLILKNAKGNEWVFPENVGEDNAIATLVYSTILNWNDHVEGFCSRYMISLEVQELE